MLKTRDGRVIAGLGLVVVGFALLLAALAFEHERGVRVGEHTRDAQHDGSRMPEPRGQTGPFASGDAATSTVPAASSLAPSDAGAAREEAQASNPDGAVGTPLTQADAADSGRGDGAVRAPNRQSVLFRFFPGGANMTQTELARLIATAKTVAAHPNTAVSIEGFPDKPSHDAGTTGVALGRARTAQAIFVQAGLPLKQVTITTGQPDPARKLTQAVRISLDPSVPELETP